MKTEDSTKNLSSHLKEESKSITDEEIREESKKRNGHPTTGEQTFWELGAKWMRDKQLSNSQEECIAFVEFVDFYKLDSLETPYTYKELYSLFKKTDKMAIHTKLSPDCCYRVLSDAVSKMRRATTAYDAPGRLTILAPQYFINALKRSTNKSVQMKGRGDRIRFMGIDLRKGHENKITIFHELYPLHLFPEMCSETPIQDFS